MGPWYQHHHDSADDILVILAAAFFHENQSPVEKSSNIQNAVSPSLLVVSKPIRSLWKSSILPRWDEALFPGILRRANAMAPEYLHFIHSSLLTFQALDQEKYIFFSHSDQSSLARLGLLNSTKTRLFRLEWYSGVITLSCSLLCDSLTRSNSPPQWYNVTP